LTLSTTLYIHTGNESYLNWALREWTWFQNTGMINAKHLVNDGLNSTCQNNKGIMWTYNQGVLLHGLSDLFHITGEVEYLNKAISIANATLQHLTDNGILQDPCEPLCDRDQTQFKGIFVRHLYFMMRFCDEQLQQYYSNFLQQNANSVWNNDRDPSNNLGLMWTGPFDIADPSRQSSALDLLNTQIIPPLTLDSNSWLELK